MKEKEKTHSFCENSHLLCTRLLQMTTPSTSGEGGRGVADPQVHGCPRAGAEGQLGAREPGYTKLFRQEAGPNLEQIFKCLHSDRDYITGLDKTGFIYLINKNKNILDANLTAETVKKKQAIIKNVKIICFALSHSVLSMLSRDASLVPV